MLTLGRHFGQEMKVRKMENWLILFIVALLVFGIYRHNKSNAVGVTEEREVAKAHVASALKELEKAG